MGSEPSESPNWPYITHLANCRNRNSPIDSSDESELVSGQRRNLQWRCGRPQQQNPSGDQTILRLSHLRSHGNCPLSQLGAAPRTGISPQILLRRLKYKPFRIILPTAASVGSGSGLTPHITVGWSRHANQWHAACSRRTHIDDSHPQNADFAWTPYVCRGSHDGSFRPVRLV